MLPLLTISIIILGTYDFLFFATLQSEPLVHEPQSWPQVSILTCVKDNEEGLRRLAARLATQSYRAEVQWVVVDDGDSLGPNFDPRLPYNFTLTIVVLKDKELPGKKGAVLAGWEQVQHDLILSIDADCVPRTNQWIRELIRPLTGGTPAVLGYGDYEKRPGLLSDLIQTETAQTAMLYLSSARRAKPYMAVGRNWAYRRWSTMADDLRADADVLSGDDDLLLQRRNLSDVSLRWRIQSHSVSIAPETRAEWLRQKMRHAETGRRYDPRSLIYLALFHGAQVSFWIGLLGGCFYSPYVLLSLMLSLAYAIMSTLLRYPFYKAIGKTSLLWKRWYLTPILLGFMFLWGLGSLRPRKNWNAPT